VLNIQCAISQLHADFVQVYSYVYLKILFALLFVYTYTNIGLYKPERQKMYPAFKLYTTEAFSGFYRAMHFSAKRGIATACRLSVRPSVRL